jgi:Cu-Zn family superoxide dismutase
MRGTTYWLLAAASSFLWLSAVTAHAQEVRVEMRQISAQGVGEPIGTITLAAEGQGVKLTTDLRGLAPGQHGFHTHQNPSCEPAEKQGQMAAGEAAGEHHDPASTNTHQGPEGQGHLGDLPRLEIAADGTAKQELRAPRLSLADLRGRALIIHEGGDTYSDTPELGGGGGRIACGVVPR